MPANFFNPVRLTFGVGSLQRLAETVSGRRAALLGTEGSLKRGLEDSIRAVLGSGLVAVHRGVRPNPTVASIASAAEELAASKPEVLIAAGGGSTLDTAKGVAAALCRTGKAGPAWLSRHLREGAPLPAGFSPLPVIAVPTTAGTGSEVTPFATVWDEKSGAKHSLTHDLLYPEHALVDPALTASMPEDLTVFTGLDAFSHALESLWNRNRNPVSEAFAARAAASLLVALPKVVREPSNLEYRARVQEAAVLAGMAISGTRTALAHSISYPLTAELDVPHGLACSFTLAEVLRANAAAAPQALAPLLQALGARTPEEGVERIYAFFRELQLGKRLKAIVPATGAFASVTGTFISPGRADNNLASVDDAQARKLLVRAWELVTSP